MGLVSIFYTKIGSKIKQENRTPVASHGRESLQGLDVTEIVAGRIYRVFVKKPNSTDLYEGAIEVMEISVEDNTVFGDFQFYDGKNVNPVLPTRLSLLEYSVFPMYGYEII
jgi:hypothetical protein